MRQCIGSESVLNPQYQRDFSFAVRAVTLTFLANVLTTSSKHVAELTVNSRHFTSLAAPTQPTKDRKQIAAEADNNIYTAPENRFVFNKSFIKLRSINVQRLKQNTIAPPTSLIEEYSRNIRFLRVLFYVIMVDMLFILTNITKFDTMRLYLTNCPQQSIREPKPIVFSCNGKLWTHKGLMYDVLLLLKDSLSPILIYEV